jgi:pimeloyl-ACP methyl ester carboxylesterase
VTAEAVHRGGEGAPLVLIHGFSGTRAHWDPVLGGLERSHDVLAVNLLGHLGGPELADGTEPTVQALIDAVERDMDDAGLQTAHLVGNSLGGWIALELARRGRARSVAAISPAGGWESGTRAEKRLRALFSRNHRLTTLLLPRLDSLMRRPRMRRLLLAQVAARGDRIPAAAAAALARNSLGCSIYFELMDAIMRDGPPKTLDGITCPVLLAWGTRDRILPLRRYSERLRRMLPDAQWVELHGLGHVPMSDDPDLIVRTIGQFVADAAARTPVAA